MQLPAELAGLPDVVAVEKSDEVALGVAPTPVASACDAAIAIGSQNGDLTGRWKHPKVIRQRC